MTESNKAHSETGGPFLLVKDILVNDIEYQKAMAYLTKRWELKLKKWRTFDAKRKVYFMYNKGLVKIGSSIDPEDRLREFKTAEPDIILLFSRHGGSPLESILHKEFKEDRIKGEWFIDSERLRNRIIELGG